MNDRSSARLREIGQFWTVSIFSGWTSIPSFVKTWSRKLPRCWKNEQFFPCNLRFSVLNRLRISRSRSRWVSKSLLKIMISSNYTRQVSYVSPQRTKSISRWKTDGAHVRPNGITRYRKQPRRVTKAVLSLSASRIGMVWYPERKSKVVNHTAPFMDVRHVSMWGSGYES